MDQVELDVKTRQGQILVQNVVTNLNKALDQAIKGEDYGSDWEAAQRDMFVLLRFINEVKYKVSPPVWNGAINA